MTDEICECGKRRFDWVHETAILREDLELPGEHLIHPFKPVPVQHWFDLERARLMAEDKPVAPSQSVEEARWQIAEEATSLALAGASGVTLHFEALERAVDALIEAVRGEQAALLAQKDASIAMVTDAANQFRAHITALQTEQHERDALMGGAHDDLRLAREKMFAGDLSPYALAQLKDRDDPDAMGGKAQRLRQRMDADIMCAMEKITDALGERRVVADA